MKDCTRSEDMSSMATTCLCGQAIPQSATYCPGCGMELATARLLSPIIFVFALGLAFGTLFLLAMALDATIGGDVLANSAVSKAIGFALVIVLIPTYKLALSKTLASLRKKTK